MNKYILSERQNLFEPNDYISIYAKIDNNPDISSVENAVRKAFKANETTMSRIVIENNGQVRYEKKSNTGCKLINAQKNWKTVINENEKKPFELWNGELVRVFIWTDGHILIMSHHLAGDGKSVCLFLGDVIKVLNGEELEYKAAKVLSKDELESMSRLSYVKKKYVMSLNQYWKKHGRVYGWNDYLDTHKRYWSSHSSEISVNTYNEKETKEIIDTAKRAGVTVNSLITTRIVSKYVGKNIIGIPISVRGNDLSMSNQVSGIQISYRYNNNLSLEENAKQIHKKCYEFIHNSNRKNFVLLFMASLDGSLVDGLQIAARDLCIDKKLNSTAVIMGFKGKKRRDIGITNLGVVELFNEYKHENEHRYTVKDMIFVPPAVVYSDNIYGISTINGRLSVTYHGMR